ncbi:Radical SAM domain protein [Haliangium ochraceum DSM 14365]|uniref:Radical SAM domain protein n=2 Tax=Haliangium ochraceum TaxID=80816 RepID=D0LTE1_HALO1|nr:Radical SAM domain protein [Haliangium ochraceum DSM 14365]
MNREPPPDKSALEPVRVLFVALSGFEDSLLSLGLLHLQQRVNYAPQCPGTADWLYLDDELLLGKSCEREPTQLRSLEYEWVAREVDVLIFSLSHPVLLPWMLTVLDAAGLPALASDRRPDDPVVVVGNVATSNPEPLAPFVDVALIGAAEESLLELIACVHGSRRGGAAWQEPAARLPGAYVPGLYQLTGPAGVQRPVRADSDTPPQVISVPSAELAYQWTRHTAPRVLPHRLVMSPNLGCRASCHFCRVGQDPYSEAPMRDLRDYVERGVAAGATQAVLHSLSLSQYRMLGELIEALDTLEVTVGSMRADELTPRKMALLQRLDAHNSLFQSQRSAGRRLVLAPETASPGLMPLLGKRFTEPLLRARVQSALDIGVSSLMLYYIVGLPGESHADIAAIAAQCARLYRMGAWESFEVKVTQFEAEPGTPLEGEPLVAARAVSERVDTIRLLLDDELGPGRVRVHLEPEPLRLYRVLLKRGDRSAGLAALWLHRRGVAPMELTPELREQARAAVGLESYNPLARFTDDRPTPWSFIQHHALARAQRGRS